MPSELKRLLDTIEEERLATLRGMNGFASGTARHAFIQSKRAKIDQCHQRLIELVGDEEVVTKCVMEIIDCADCLFDAEQWRAKCLEQERLKQNPPDLGEKL